MLKAKIRYTCGTIDTATVLRGGDDLNQYLTNSDSFMAPEVYGNVKEYLVHGLIVLMNGLGGYWPVCEEQYQEVLVEELHGVVSVDVNDLKLVLRAFGNYDITDEEFEASVRIKEGMSCTQLK